MDNGFITGSVFLDLSKAFDTVDHEILLNKLHCLGLNSNSMEWFKSLWSWTGHLNRQLSLVFEASHSRGATRSILGPLLFIIYVNDLPRCLKYCKIIINADDTLIHYSAKSTQDVQTFLNKDLESASLWLQSNLLTLNCSKSRFLLFGSKRTCQKNQAPSTTTRSVDTLSFCNTSSFWLRCHYLGEQKQCYRNERSSNSTKQGS